MGCGGSSNTEQKTQTEPSSETQDDSVITPAEETSFNGRVVKGIISNAVIKAYPIVNQNGVYTVDSNSKPVISRTNGSGYYQLKPGKGRNDQYYYLEMVTDDQSQMICDFHTGCESSLTGDYAAFGEAFTLSSGFTLSSVVKSKAGKINHAPISPLTHLAVQYMMTLPERFSPSNINISVDFIKTKFGLGDKALSLLPSDLTALSEIKKLKEEELRLGILSAAFAPIIEIPDWDNISTLSFKDLFLNAYNLAQFLSTQVDSRQHLEALSVIEEESQTLYESHTEQTLVIVEQPKSINATEGDNVSLTVVATSSEIISYQWTKDDVDIIGATSDVLSIANINLADNGIYSAKVFSGNNALTSLVALVSVSPKQLPVTITSHPQSVVTREGEQIDIQVIAEGSGALSYQWQKGGSIIPNETSSRLNFNAISLSHEGTYSVTVSNDISSLQSNFANITVNEIIEAISIIDQPSSTETIEGNITTFKVSASGDGYIAYQWRKNAVAINNAYEQSYSILSTSLSDAGTYDVVLTNSEGSITSSPATLSVIPDISPIIINQQPQHTTINEGETTSLTVFASGDGTINYEWFKDGSPIANSNNATLTIISGQLIDQGNYRVIISNEISTESSQTAYLTITPTPSPEPVMVELSWTAPQFRDDGSTLTLSEISGYSIIYGTELMALNTSTEISGGEITSSTLQLMPSNYYFKIATIDNNLIQGDFSEAIQLSVE